jgi:hypothetical protein
VGFTQSRVGPLYTAILEAGFSITGFARRVGIHRANLYRIDRGIQTPEPAFWQRAAVLLGVPEESINPKARIAA